MARLKNLFLIILGTTFVSSISSSKPRIFLKDGNKAPSDITMPVGGNFSLTCRDVQPVQWRLHHGLHVNTAIDCEDQDHDELPFCVSITIININYTDVGFYPCIHNTSDNWADSYQYHQSFEDAQAVYIFVKDPDNLLVPTHLAITGEMNKRLTVPCKPTFPDVTVDIEKIYDKETHDFLTMGFDNKKGFRMMYVGTGHITMFRCIASFAEIEQSLDGTLNIDNNVSANDVTPDKPRLTPSNSVKVWQQFDNRYDILEGSNINMTCTADQPGLQIFFTHPPNANKTGLHEIHRYHDVNNHATKDYVITNADQEEDNGTYGCYAMKYAKKSANASIDINIIREGSQHLEMREIDYEYDEKEISYTFTFRAYPMPKFTWKKKEIVDGNIIETTITEGDDEYTTPEYDFQINAKHGEVMLNLKGVTWKTIANYSLQAEISNTDLIVSSNFTVEIGAKPQNISLEAEGFIHILKQNQTFLIKCFARGHPAPKLSLEFQPCMPNCGEFSDVSTTSDNNESVHYKSLDGKLVKERTTHWTGKTQSQGKYRCRATNDHGSILSQEKPLLLTDGGKGLELYLEVSVEDKVKRSNEDLLLIEKDKVIIQCRANRMRTHSMPELVVLSSTEEISIIECKEKCSIKDTTTELSFLREVSYPAIEVERINNTKLVCRNPDDHSLNDTVTLFVKRMEAPVWLNSTDPSGPLKDVKINKTDEKHTLRCATNGSPQPKVTWQKDDFPVYQSDHIDIQNDKLTFKFLKMDDSGIYKCMVSNRGGAIESSAYIEVIDPNANSLAPILIPICVILTCIIFCLCIYFFIRCQKDKKKLLNLQLEEQVMFNEGDPDNLNPYMSLTEQAELLPYDNKYEVSIENIILDGLLGQGAFGRVYKATALGITPGQARTTVAVKMMRSRTDCAQLKALRSEVKIMCHIGRHVNIVNLLGACSKNMATKGELLLLVEYCKHGNLLDYMRRQKQTFINQINEFDKIDPTMKGTRVRTRSGSSRPMSQKRRLSERRTSRGLQYATLSFKGEEVHYGDIQNSNGTDDSGQALWIAENKTANCVEPTRQRTASATSAASTASVRYVTTDMSSATYESSNGSDVAPSYVLAGVQSPSLCSQTLLSWAYQIARGMEYLSFKKVLHGDLAARNILLTEDMVVKISDFGLAKDIYKDDNYKKKTNGPVPVKWMALESLRDGVFSTQSDTWAYGVVLWEIFTLGQNPYPGVEYDGDFIKKLEKGIRLEQPKYATYELYNTMLKCWEEDPLSRPSFSNLENELGAMIGQTERQYYLDLNQQYQFDNTGSTFLARLASPDYAAKNRETTPTSIDLEGYEMPSPDLAEHVMPVLVHSYGGPVQPFSSPDNSAGAYIAMCSSVGSPSPSKSDGQFDFDTVEYINDNADTDRTRSYTLNREAWEEDEDLNEDTQLTEENYIVMEQSYNDKDTENITKKSFDKPKKPMRLDLKKPPRTKLIKQDSGFYSPTTPPSLQSNPSYMTMSYSNMDENENLSKNEQPKNSEKNKPYLNLADATEIVKHSDYGNIYQDDQPSNEDLFHKPSNEDLFHSASEGWSGLGSICESPSVVAV